MWSLVKCVCTALLWFVLLETLSLNMMPRSASPPVDVPHSDTKTFAHLLILLILLVLNADTRVGRQPDTQATPCPRRLSGSIPDRPSRASHS